MSVVPEAEIDITPGLVRALVSTAPGWEDEASSVALRRAGTGWDCEMWRLGAGHAVRLPRRALAAPLIRHEQRALPVLAPWIQAEGVSVPLPLHAGGPGDGFPWPWSIVPWFPGSAASAVPRAARSAWAGDLARAVAALHRPAPDDHPVNAFRGGPLPARTSSVLDRLDSLTGSLPAPLLSRAARVWERGTSARPWTAPPVWLHGDLHPGNLVVDAAGLRAIVDFGDVTAGDPAYDLAIAWLAFDSAGRAAFRSACGRNEDEDLWLRARAWAVAMGALLAAHGEDDPGARDVGVAALWAAADEG